MLTVEEIKDKLKDRTLTKVAEATGLSYPTVWKIANCESERVEYGTVKKLSDYLEASA
jgi:transcriptional regulator with XRE-family HTH domain